MHTTCKRCVGFEFYNFIELDLRRALIHFYHQQQCYISILLSEIFAQSLGVFGRATEGSTVGGVAQADIPVTDESGCRVVYID